AGEADQHLAAVQPTNLVGVALHDDFAQRHLAVTADGRLAVPPDGQNGRGTHAPHATILRRGRITQGVTGSQSYRTGRRAALATFPWCGPPWIMIQKCAPDP